MRDVHIGLFLPFSRGRTLAILSGGFGMPRGRRHGRSDSAYALENYYGMQIFARQVLATSAVDSTILFIVQLLFAAVPSQSLVTGAVHGRVQIQSEL